MSVHPAVAHAEKAKVKNWKVNESFEVVVDQLGHAMTPSQLMEAVRRCFRVAKHVKFDEKHGCDREVNGTKPKTVYVIYGGARVDKEAVYNHYMRQGSVAMIAPDDLGVHLKRRLAQGKNVLVNERVMITVNQAWVNRHGKRMPLIDVWVASFSLISIIEGAL